MPREETLPTQPVADLQTTELSALLNQLQKAEALAVVMESFSEAESFRASSVEPRWLRNEALYLGVVPQKYWKGTSVPRASTSFTLVADQIEAAAPIIGQALFTQPDWFEVTPKEGTTQQEAKQLRDQLLYQLENPGVDRKKFKSEVEQVIKDVLLKGNGYITIEHNPATRLLTAYYRDARDIYVDPGCTDPLNIEASRYVILRDFKTMEEVRAWRGMPGISLPSDAQLSALAKSASLRRAEFLKQRQANMQGSSLAPGLQLLTANPTGNKLEILTYYSKTQIVMTIGTEWVLFSEKNPYGFFPVVSAVATIVNGQHYGRSIADRQADLQGVIEGLINGHLDELSLAINPPRGQRSGATVTSGSNYIHPGQVINTPDPKRDLNFMVPNGVTQNVFQSVEFLIRSADSRTGYDSAGGKFKPGNANRTLGGMQMQAQGGFTRISVLVEHLENALEQMLHKMVKMTFVTTGENVYLPAKQDESKAYLVNSNVLNKPVNVCIRASSQMLTREKLMAALPTITQFYTAPNFQQGLAESDQKLNWAEMARFIKTATGIDREFEFIVPLSPEEKQARQQPPPEVMMQAQQKQQDIQTRLQLGQMKSQTEIQKAVIAKQPAPPDPSEMLREQQKAQMEREKAAIEVELQQAKLEHEKQMNAMKLQMEQAKMALQAQKAQLDQFTAQSKAQTDLQVNEIKGQQALRQAEIANEQSARHAEESHAAKLKMQEAAGKNTKERSK